MCRLRRVPHGARRRELVGNVGVLRRVVTAGDRDLVIAMVGGVFTDRAYRGRGIAACLLAHADELIRTEGGLSHALLMCGDHLVSMYGRHGCEVVAGPTRFEQPDGPREATSRIMVKRHGDAPWPSGPIDLRGLPA
jgi:GNAT superfamily N-acetyltransferase